MMQAVILLIMPFQAAGVGLSSWLSGLRLQIPEPLDITKHLPSIIPDLELNITDGYCESIRLTNASIDASGSADEFAVALHVDGLGLSCHLDAAASMKSLSTGSIGLDVTLDRSALKVAFALGLSDEASPGVPLPTNVSDASCDFLDFNLNIAAHASNPLERPFAAAVDLALKAALESHALDRVICALVHSKLVEGPLSKKLQQLSAKLVASGALNASVPLPTLQSWTPSEEATNVHELLSTGATGHAIKAILGDGTVDVSSGDLAHLNFTALVDGIQNHAHTTLNLPHIGGQWNLPGSSALDLRLETPRVSNLMGKAKDVIINSSNYSVSLAAQNVGADVSTRAWMQLTLPATIARAGPLELDLSVLAGVEKLSLHTAARLGIQGWRALKDYGTDQLTELGCLKNVLDSTGPPEEMSLAVLALGAGFEQLHLKLSSADPLLDGMVAGVSSLAAAAMTSFQPALLRILNGQGVDHVRDALNQQLSSAIVGATSCPVSNVVAPVNEPFASFNEVWFAVFLGVTLLAGLAMTRGSVVRCLRGIEKAGQEPREQEQQAELEQPLEPADEGAALRRQPVVSSAGSVAMQATLLGIMGLVLLSMFGLQASVGVGIVDPNPASGPHVQHMGHTLELTMWYQLQLLWSWGFGWMLFLMTLLIVLVPAGRVAATFLCWYLPASKLSSEKRIEMLSTLANTTKLEQAGTFLLIFIIGGQHFEFEDGVKFMIETSPRYAYFTACGAALLHLGVLDSMVQAHYRATPSKTKEGLELPAAGVVVEQAKSVSQGTDHRVAAGVWLLSLTTPVLIVLSLCLTSWSVTWGGILGLLKFDLQGTEVTNNSVWSMLSTFQWPDGTAYDATFVDIATFLFLLALIWMLALAPLLQSFATLALWAWPLPQQKRQRLVGAARAFWRWQALDVFALTLALACALGWVISAYVERLFGTASSLEPICEQLRPVDLPCLRYFIKPAPGLGVMLAAAAAQLASFCAVNKLAETQSGQN